MRQWLSVSLVVGAVLVGGCGGDKDKDDGGAKQSKTSAIDGGKAGADTKTPTSSNAAVVKMTNYAEILCACKDAACATGVHNTYATWITGFSTADSKMTKADFDAWTAQQKTLLACWNKFKDAKPVAPDLNKPTGAVKLMTGFTDTMCACKDAKCAAKVDKEAQAAAKNIDRKVLRQAAQDLQTLYKRFKSCKDKAESSDSDDGDVVEEIKAFADDMCKCTDGTCASKVHRSMMAWVKKYFKGGKKKGTKANVEKWKKAQKKFNKCYIRAMKARLRDKPPKASDDITRGIARYARRVCACKTSLCATEAMSDHSKWVREHRTELYTGADRQRYRQLLLEASARALACAKKLR